MVCVVIVVKESRSTTAPLFTYYWIVTYYWIGPPKPFLPYKIEPILQVYKGNGDYMFSTGYGREFQEDVGDTYDFTFGACSVLVVHMEDRHRGLAVLTSDVVYVQPDLTFPPPYQPFGPPKRPAQLHPQGRRDRDGGDACWREAEDLRPARTGVEHLGGLP